MEHLIITSNESVIQSPLDCAVSFNAKIADVLACENVFNRDVIELKSWKRKI
jgi:hypothetical protein